MSKITVRELKEKLQEYIDVLDNCDDSKEVPTVSNTYFLKGSNYWMQFGRVGFVGLDTLEYDLEDEEDEEDDVENRIATEEAINEYVLDNR